MADTKVSNLPSITVLDGDELIPVVDSPSGSPATSKVTAKVLSGWSVINESVLSTTAASVSFASIPATFRSLFLVVQAKFSAAITSDALSIRFNNDSAGNYDWELLDVQNATIGAAGSVAATSLRIGSVTGSSAPANSPSVTHVTIPNYAGTTFHKNAICLNFFSQTDTAAGQRMTNFGGRWRSTAAINRVDVLPASGNFIAGSTFTLYGLRGQ